MILHRAFLLAGGWSLMVLAACGDDGGRPGPDATVEPPDGGPSPCEGVDCGGLGTCEVVAGQATCDCVPGYHAEGATCVLDSVDCAAPAVLCVDDTPGETQEFATIQEAADGVSPGEVILIFDGRYAGFELATSGTASERITVRALGTGAVIDADGPDGYGVFLRNVSHVTIEGLRIVGMTARGLAHREATPTEPSVGLIIRDNVVQDSGAEGMYLSEVSEALIEGNEITGSGASGADLTHGIYLANAGSDRTTLRRNVIRGSGTAGIHFNGDLSIGGDGIISGLLVEENVLQDNGQNGLNLDGVQDSVIRNNLITGNVLNGIRAYAIDAAEGPRGLVIVHNTILVPVGAGWCVRITEDLGDNAVWNNILLNEGDNGSIGLDATAGFSSAHNAVVDVFTPDRDDTLLDLAGWQALGHDEGSFVTTPAALFVSAPGGDFSLIAGAPAVDAGLASFLGVDAPLTDLAGSARVPPPDLGAYERP